MIRTSFLIRALTITMLSMTITQASDKDDTKQSKNTSSKPLACTLASTALYECGALGKWYPTLDHQFDGRQEQRSPTICGKYSINTGQLNEGDHMFSVFLQDPNAMNKTIQTDISLNNLATLLQPDGTMSFPLNAYDKTPTTYTTEKLLEPLKAAIQHYALERLLAGDKNLRALHRRLWPIADDKKQSTVDTKTSDKGTV